MKITKTYDLDDGDVYEYQTDKQAKGMLHLLQDMFGGYDCIDNDTLSFRSQLKYANITPNQRKKLEEMHEWFIDRLEYHNVDLDI